VTYLPRLDRHAGQGALPHATPEELLPAGPSLAFSVHNGLNFLPFGNDPRVVDVAASLDVGQRLDGLLVAADLGEPPRRARQEGQAEDEEEARDELGAPGGAKRSGALDRGAAVADEVHDQDTELDGQLLDDDE
jgi:hypothetical protein